MNNQQDQQPQVQPQVQPQQNVPCCDTPFLQFNSSGTIETCLCCGIKTQLIVRFECPYCHAMSEGLCELDLEDSEGNTDWVNCESCDYDFRKHELIIRAQKVRLN